MGSFAKFYYVAADSLFSLPSGSFLLYVSTRLLPPLSPPFSLICFHPCLKWLPALPEWSVRSWGLFKLDMSCVGRESDRELSPATVTLPTLEMFYVNTIHFIPPWEEIIIGISWKGGKWDLHSGEKHMGVGGKRKPRLTFHNPPFFLIDSISETVKLSLHLLHDFFPSQFHSLGRNT